MIDMLDTALVLHRQMLVMLDTLAERMPAVADLAELQAEGLRAMEALLDEVLEADDPTALESEILTRLAEVEAGMDIIGTVIERVMRDSTVLVDNSGDDVK